MTTLEPMVSAADRQLVEELYPKLHRFAAATAPWDVEADDLLQEALTRVIARGPLSSLDEPAAYLRKTMTNLAMNHYRHGGVRRRAMAKVAASNPMRSSDIYPSDLADLAALPPRTRAILYLSEVDGYTYDEIGILVGCSATAARMAAMRGRRSLRVSLSGGAQ